MSSKEEAQPIQIITYIRRKQDLTREQFYDHWENVHGPKVAPWAEKMGILRYQQVHVSGSMVPQASRSSAPNASTADLPTTPIEFDGIAMFLVPSLETFVNAFKDPYYLAVIEPDERVLIDKAGPGSGIVASFRGKMIEIYNRGEVLTADKGDEYKKNFEEFEAKQKS